MAERSARSRNLAVSSSPAASDAIVEEHVELRAVVDGGVQGAGQQRAQLVGEPLAPLANQGVVGLPLGVRVADEDVVLRTARRRSSMQHPHNIGGCCGIAAGRQSWWLRSPIGEPCARRSVRREAPSERRLRRPECRAVGGADRVRGHRQRAGGGAAGAQDLDVVAAGGGGGAVGEPVGAGVEGAGEAGPGLRDLPGQERVGGRDQRGVGGGGVDRGFCRPPAARPPSFRGSGQSFRWPGSQRGDAGEMLAVEVFDQLAIFRGRNLLDAVAWACGQEPFDAPVDLVGIGKMETRQGQILRDRVLGQKGRL